MNREVFAAVAAALERGEPAALVTIVSTTGSTPQRVGAKMLVFGDGRTVGTIGGGCYENDAFGKAREAILTRKPQLVHYELDDDFAQETGLICGGQMDVYIEPIEPSPELYIIGGGHVGFHLARVAHEVGFRVHVIDDREKFANAERFPTAVEVIVDDIPSWIARVSLPARRPSGLPTAARQPSRAARRSLKSAARSRSTFRLRTSDSLHVPPDPRRSDPDPQRPPRRHRRRRLDQGRAHRRHRLEHRRAPRPRRRRARRLRAAGPHPDTHSSLPDAVSRVRR